MNTFWAELTSSVIGSVALVLMVVAVPSYFGVVPWYGLVAVALFLPFMLGRVVSRNVLLIKIEARRPSAVAISPAAANARVPGSGM